MLEGLFPIGKPIYPSLGYILELSTNAYTSKKVSLRVGYLCLFYFFHKFFFCCFHCSSHFTQHHRELLLFTRMSCSVLRDHPQCPGDTRRRTQTKTVKFSVLGVRWFQYISPCTMLEAGTCYLCFSGN